MISSLFTYKQLKFIILPMLICTLISGPIYGQSDNSYKSVNIDSLLAVPITLQKDKDYGIYNLIFPVYYTGEIRMMGVSVHERLYLLKKAHPHVNFSICNCNTVGVFKTRDNNTLLMTFSEDELLNKLRPYD